MIKFKIGRCIVKRFIFAAVLLAAGSLNASAAETAITCWYDSAGAKKSSDSAQNLAVFGLQKTDNSGDQAYAYTIMAEDGTFCPRTIVPGATKLCSPFAPNAWRDVTPVPRTFTLEDCMALGPPIGSLYTQLGCLWDSPRSDGRRVSLGTQSKSSGRPGLPNPNCGW